MPCNLKRFPGYPPGATPALHSPADLSHTGGETPPLPVGGRMPPLQVRGRMPPLRQRHRRVGSGPAATATRYHPRVNNRHPQDPRRRLCQSGQRQHRMAPHRGPVTRPRRGQGRGPRLRGDLFSQRPGGERAHRGAAASALLGQLDVAYSPPSSMPPPPWPLRPKGPASTSGPPGGWRQPCAPDGAASALRAGLGAAQASQLVCRSQSARVARPWGREAVLES
jgi:hypothetical protein